MIEPVWAPSPNQDERPLGAVVDHLMLHYTGMQSAEVAIARLRDPDTRVSSHYVVDEDGTVLALVAEERRAWHAGVSYWRGRTGLNDVSIGIEIVNPGHEWGYRDFAARQMAAVRALCLGILSRHPISPCNVIAHSDAAPDRKEDPGERFDWQGLARDGIGLWPFGVADRGTGDPFLDADALGPIRTMLARIGYPIALAGPCNDELATVLRAFQRHWRPEAVTGQADIGTRDRLAAVARLIDGTTPASA